MKVFLNDRVIVLEKMRPEGQEHHHITSGMQLAGLLSEFEADPARKRLVLYSDYYVSLKREFLSLFEVVLAAGGLVKNEKGEILFIFRRGRWDLPKGKISLNPGKAREKKKDAALREVREETGLQKAEITGKLKKTYHIFYSKRIRMLKKTSWYAMRAQSGQKLVPQTEEEITQVKWIPAEELPKVLESTYPSLRKLFE
jgi:8-oxo-dGTP pyrophosphatase MutT (NUDIX family)